MQWELEDQEALEDEGDVKLSKKKILEETRSERKLEIKGQEVLEVESSQLIRMLQQNVSL